MHRSPPLERREPVLCKVPNPLCPLSAPFMSPIRPFTASALRKFQRAHGLEPTGLADDSTKAALRTAYGR